MGTPTFATGGFVSKRDSAPLALVTCSYPVPLRLSNPPKLLGGSVNVTVKL